MATQAQSQPRAHTPTQIQAANLSGAQYLPDSAPLNENPAATAGSLRTPLRDSLDAKYGLKPFLPVHDATEDIDFVKLEAIDFGKYKEGSSPEAVKARRELAGQLDYSVRTHGFFFITNHGITDEEFARVNSITQALHAMPEAEKIQYRSGGVTSDEDVDTDGAERGAGFKPLKYWRSSSGTRDNISFYNYSHVVHDAAVNAQKHPEIARVYLNEVSNYFRYIHYSVLKRLTVLCDIILDLPEGTIYDRYFRVLNGDIPASGGGFGRLMVYYGRNSDDTTLLRGHSDSDGFTFLSPQPMVSLQIRDYATGDWRYVKPVPGALTVNIGDAIEFLTGGYFRSTIHRVVDPPPSQQGHLRQAIIYFCKPSWETIIDPEELGSPHLERLGVRSQPSWERINYGQWDLEKSRLFGKSTLNDVDGDAPKAAYLFGRLAERWVPTVSTEDLAT